MITGVVANDNALRQWPGVHFREKMAGNERFELFFGIRTLKYVNGDITFHR
jgi:hypothetical protein